MVLLVNLEKIIGAVACIVFNCKNRKLGIYIAKDNDGFAVKGTINYDEKSLRKLCVNPKNNLVCLKRQLRLGL